VARQLKLPGYGDAVRLGHGGEGISARFQSCGLAIYSNTPCRATVLNEAAIRQQ
jgi:hypothetical protein